MRDVAAGFVLFSFCLQNLYTAYFLDFNALTTVSRTYIQPSELGLALMPEFALIFHFHDFKDTFGGLKSIQNWVLRYSFIQ